MERFFVLDKFNTWYDWRLIVTEKDVTPPAPKTNYVEIDGMSGTLDLSESLTGEITYEDRTISASFWTSEGSYKDRAVLLRKIATSLHGKKIRVIEPDDPDHYYYGRVKIDSVKNTLPYAEFSMVITCEPWRYALSETVRSIEVSGETVDLVINNYGVKTLCPTITITGSVTITYKGGTVDLTAGSYRISDLKFYQGTNVVSVSGNGSAIFTYTEADL